MNIFKKNKKLFTFYFIFDITINVFFMYTNFKKGAKKWKNKLNNF